MLEVSNKHTKMTKFEANINFQQFLTIFCDFSPIVKKPADPKKYKIKKVLFLILFPYKSRSAYICLLGRIKFYLVNIYMPTSIYKEKPSKIMIF